MIARTHAYTVDLDSGTVEMRWDSPLTYGDKAADNIVVTLMRGSAPATVSGLTAILYGILSGNGTTAFKSGDVVGNVVTAEMDETFYAVPGKIDLLLQLSEGTTVVYTPLRVTAYVKSGQTGELVSAGEEFTLAELEAIAAACVTATDNADTATVAANQAVSDVEAALDASMYPDSEDYGSVADSVDSLAPIPAVRYDADQALNAAQQAQARINIDVLTRYIFGMQYLRHFHGKLKAETSSTVILAGDSTTAGGLMDATMDTDYYRDKLVSKVLRNGGHTEVTVTNDGHSGGTAVNWAGNPGSDYLTTELAAAPDLLIVQFGNINDAPGGIETFLTNMEAGLVRIRAAHSANDMSVILMMPTPAINPLITIDADWYDDVYAGLLGLAEEYQCTFVDTYNFLKTVDDVKWTDCFVMSGTSYYSNSSLTTLVGTTGSAYAATYVNDTYCTISISSTTYYVATDDTLRVHPDEVGNSWITSLLAPCILPKVLEKPSNIDLLWTNPSPTASYAAATLTTTDIPTLGEYDAILVTVRADNTLQNEGSPILIIKGNAGQASVHWDYTAHRQVTFNATPSIAFAGGYVNQTIGSGTSADQYAIPYKIYGVKHIGGM